MEYSKIIAVVVFSFLWVNCRELPFSCENSRRIINPDVVTAWEKAGATFGWMEWHKPWRRWLKNSRKAPPKWIKTKGHEFNDFYWQSGYGAFSIGQSGLEDLKRYIANQKEHHRHTKFQEEFRIFLAKYEVEYDERYVWD